MGGAAFEGKMAMLGRGWASSLGCSDGNCVHTGLIWHLIWHLHDAHARPNANLAHCSVKRMRQGSGFANMGNPALHVSNAPGSSLHACSAEMHGVSRVPAHAAHNAGAHSLLVCVSVSVAVPCPLPTYWLVLLRNWGCSDRNHSLSCCCARVRRAPSPMCMIR